MLKEQFRPCHAGSERGRHARRRLLAHDLQARRAKKHLADLPALALARTAPGREPLAASARQLTLKPRFDNYDDIIEAYDARKHLVAQPKTITSI